MSSTSLPLTDTIDAGGLRRMIAQDLDVRILDVRSGGEFETVHIPGSLNVPLDTLREHVRDLADVEHPVVLVCKSGARASEAHANLTGAGKQRLHLLTGGMDAWEAGGGDVIRGDVQRWALDRQVRLVAGSISLVAILASIVAPKAKWAAGGVAAGLTFSGLSNTCALGNLLMRLPYNRTDDCDIDGVLDDLRVGR